MTAQEKYESVRDFFIHRTFLVESEFSRQGRRYISKSDYEALKQRTLKWPSATLSYWMAFSDGWRRAKA